MQISLPNASQWHPTDNYAVNLRSARGGLVPVGSPATVSRQALSKAFKLADGRILSVASNGIDLYLDGEYIGSLEYPFATMVADNGSASIIVLTQHGSTEWVVNGKLCGPFEADVDISTAVGSSISAPVQPLSLRGDYPRASGSLSAVDCAAGHDALASALRALEDSAGALGRRIQPVVMAWQIKDSSERVIARGVPQVVQSSAAFQGTRGCEMILDRTDGKFTGCSAGAISALPYSITVSVKAEAELWRRNCAHVLEVLAIPPLQYISGASGPFTTQDSAHSVLSLAPLGADAASLEQLKANALSSFAANARVVARVLNPMAGCSVQVGVAQLSADSGWADSLPSSAPSDALWAGSMVDFVDAASVGTIMVASAQNPLTPIAAAKVANGRIFRLAVPAGGSGGWNYARHHILAFAADGVYAVSVDRALSTISASLILPCGISRADAVAVSPEAIFCCSAGSLFRLRGSRCETLVAPIPPIALGWCNSFGELWLIDGEGRCATLSSAGLCSLRSDLVPSGFISDSLAVDAAGALRDLNREAATLTQIEWCRREPFVVGSGSVAWHLSAVQAVNVNLTLMADSGGVSQRITELTVNGAVNAPISTRFVAPRREYLAAKVSGLANIALFSRVELRRASSPSRCQATQPIVPRRRS